MDIDETDKDEMHAELQLIASTANELDSDSAVIIIVARRSGFATWTNLDCKNCAGKMLEDVSGALQVQFPECLGKETEH